MVRAKTRSAGRGFIAKTERGLSGSILSLRAAPQRLRHTLALAAHAAADRAGGENTTIPTRE